MNRHLPQNTALSKLLGVDPKRPGKRPMFRGDVAIVTSATMHVLEGLSATYPLRTYMDFPDFKMEFAHDFMRRWYQSAGWADMSFKDEQSDELPPGSIPLDWDWRNPTHIPGFDYDGEDEKERQQKKASKRLVTADNKRQERYERFASRRCAYCGITELPPRSKCSRCLSAHYCSPECQKAHWKDHKEDCRSAGIGAQR
ncbi:hypothetical protein DFH09DRAFT_212165 [Mycena vulgaris]|nr:hypothetical protein DFH09DRAFT_212165 [Mycena vulgaris]